ncbi:DUF3560 domain-containing protein (plasmid) [Streptomyces sp. BI20]|uniref:DUF3560 domain-containing protein n=1 Tax=Streptomyces sp. BI20 TaxID=3403460 RepID=UPI003C788BD0
MSITIEHTRAGGTIVTGTSKGDGTAAILGTRQFGWGRAKFHWSRTQGFWYLPHSRDHQADSQVIERAAELLRAAGHEVEVRVDETVRRTFAEAETERAERAQTRAERAEALADRASARAAGREAAARDIMRHIPFGQPILVGHHSQRRAERDQERIDGHMRASLAEEAKVVHHENRRRAAAGYEQARNNVPRSLRRIERLEADRRGLERILSGQVDHGWDLGNPESVAELTRRRDEVLEQLEHWRGVVAAAEAAGAKVWGREDFAKGDFVRSRGRWLEVLRVNAKSLSVPSTLKATTTVVTLENSDLSWTERLPYDAVGGRMSAQDMAAKLVEG